MHAVEAFQNWHEKNDLLRLAFLFLQVASDEDIEKLIGPAEFDVGLHLHGVPALHNRILNFVRTDRLLQSDARFEILALQQLLQRDATVQTHHFGKRHRRKPFAVKNRARAFRVENLESLLAVTFRVCQDLLVRELRPRRGAAAGVADHGSEIADDQNRFVAELLKLPELLQQDGVAQVQIAARRIDAEFHPQRPA